MKPLDPAQIEHLRQWMQWGADMSVPVLELLQRGHPEASVVAALEQIRPRGNALAGNAMEDLPLVRRAPPELRRIEAPFPLYTLDGFLAPEDCAAVVAITRDRLRPSPLTRPHHDAYFRTSTTANLWQIEDPRARDVDERICRTLGIRPAYAEGSQVQRYEVGQQFKPHYDSFQVGSNVYQRFAGLRGNRTWTFMVYLNDGMEGGATRFTEIDVSIRPKTGMALFWYNLLADGTPDPRTRHCGEPVTSGYKVIVTKWFRVHGDGPVLYD